MSHRSVKNNVLVHDESFAAKWESLVDRINSMCVASIKQRDDSWHQARRGTIGGSEIHKLMGFPGKDTAFQLAIQKLRGNPEEIALNEQIQKTILGKVSMSTQNKRIFSLIWSILVAHRCDSNTNCGLAKHWGTAFEDVINEYMKATYNLKVDCENKFYNPPGPFSYSPDGITLLPSSDGRAVPSLLEYKCPFTRVPGKVIPKEYVAQMKSGMDLLGLEQTLYVEAVFRLCRYDDLDTTTACHLSLRNTMRIPSGPPIAWGFMGFWIPCGSAMPSDSMDSNETIVPCLVNDLNNQELTALFCGFAAGAIKIYYSRVVRDAKALGELLEDRRVFVSEVSETPGKILGIVPYKLFSVNSHIVEREEGFLDIWRQDAQRVIDAVLIASELPVEYQDTYLASRLSRAKTSKYFKDDYVESCSSSFSDLSEEYIPIVEASDE